MSSHQRSFNLHKKSILDFARYKEAGKKFSAITCYDSAFAKLIDRTEIDMILVGDSLGNVVMGYKNTIEVTVDDIIHHCASVSRVLKHPFLVADMPFLSFRVSVEQALSNAGRLVQEGGAEAVKLEGGKEIENQVRAIVEAGIPVVGHLGLTPQSIHSLGGYKVQGRGDEARKKLVQDALALEKAGAMSLVLELVPADLAAQLSQQLKIPTIGIGAGPECDAQVLVLHDMLGFEDSFKPKFLKKYADLSQKIQLALSNYDTEVKAGVFPSAEHSFVDS